MKRKIILVALMLCIACGSIFAFGIGIQGGTDLAWGYRTGLDVTFKFEKFPLLFGLGIPSFPVGGDPLALRLSADYWITNPTIVGGNVLSLNWFIGVGVFGDLYMQLRDPIDPYFGFGARVPIGLNLYFFRRIFEAYVQIAPGVRFDFENGFDAGFYCPINYGLRVWVH